MTEKQPNKFSNYK